jgi:hypothetical protein
MPTAEIFKDRLLPGEAVVWFGRPGQGILFAPRDALLIPFSLLWGGFTIFWETMALSTRAPGGFVLFGVPFVLVGLFMIFGRFLLDAWLRARTAYALTDRRILILRWGPWPTFKAVRLDRLPEATLSESSSGRGTVRFADQAPLWSRNAGFAIWVPSLDPTPQFLAIHDAKSVFAVVQKQAYRV